MARPCTRVTSAGGYHPRMSAPRGRCDGGALSLPILASPGAVDRRRDDGASPDPAPGAGDGTSISAPRVRASRSTKWRFGVLFVIQGLMILHVIQWLVQGTTLSPVEPSEAMETAKYGIINAGAVLFALALVSTAIFGRFFCGWGCHVLLLQDGCAWLLRKVGIRPKPFRARLLMLVPLAMALYMFVWPLAYRWAIAPYLQPTLAPMKVTTHFITENFWVTFPGVMVAIPFLFVCGALTVYFLGQKGYCTYACPYGGFFAPIDRIAPLRIRVSDACEHCGHCTAVCTSNVRVHEEVAQFGMVVDPGCMKCLDCVSVCPNDALSVSWGRPASGATPNPDAVVGPPGHRHPISERTHEISRRAELGILVVGVLTVLALNAPFMATGAIKVTVPLLFASGIGAIVAFLAWKSWRVLARANEAFHGMSLRRAGRIAAAGWAWLALSSASLLVVVLVGIQNTALWVAHSFDQRVDLPVGAVFTRDAVLPSDAVLSAAARADRSYELASLIGRGGIGFVPPVQPWIDLRRSWMAAVRRDFASCEAMLMAAWAAFPEHALVRPELAVDIGRVIWVRGRLDDLDQWYREQSAAHPREANPGWDRVHRDRVTLARTDDDPVRAIIASREWLEWDPTSLEAMRQLSLLLAESGDHGEIEEGIALIHRTLEIEPNNPGAWRAIAIGHSRAGRLDEAEAALRHTVELAPENWRFWQGLGEFQREIGREMESVHSLDRATRLREAETNATQPPSALRKSSKRDAASGAE